MDTRNGRIYTSEYMAEMKEKLKELFPVENFKEMNISPTKKQMERIPPKVGRNEPCPCGSGLKFKKCCLMGER